mmetsp:Transcript_2177/g.3140  ORF Transcript_2177/g.3140 Transcript_2177/m.3140 type:complete len:249 (+) Transcript_2177:184-930(+)|eukprot:CAMPEP_0178903594 /NCGR_PEP_ID=MMETSP0786-20121207/5240_1 /TAXON_ID=186022 /ORGANISM="Thalassionema frauenfeldii, Strain CCMP 1798" /LENGTH=248 /DNA_ID=CAMNT_0020574975 /DNA_START=85 /DNA_END=831 /DNA_ORIENTATION=-
MTILRSILFISVTFFFKSVIMLQLHQLPGSRRMEITTSRRPTFLLADPSCVNVCTAELCCCQEDGVGGDEILEHLNAQNLPYPIEGAPCLGACGGGAKVSIDFVDGSYALVTGMDETLSELGLTIIDIPGKEQSTDKTSEEGSQDEAEMEFMKISDPNSPIFLDNKVNTQKDNNCDESHEIKEEEILVDEKVNKYKRVTLSRRIIAEPLGDVRDRMRQAYVEEEQTNPWLNTASYLAKKLKEKILTTD